MFRGVSMSLARLAAVAALALALLGSSASGAGAVGAGSLLTWGSNGGRSIGRTPPPSIHLPAEAVVAGEAGQPTSIAVGGSFSIFTTSTGQLFGAGNNEQLELGSAGTATKSSFVPGELPGATGPPVAVSAGFEHSLARTSTGQLFGFGRGTEGQLGPAETASANPPSPIALPGPVVEDAAGSEFTLAVTSGGNLYSFGRNMWGELGRSEKVGESTPTPGLVSIGEAVTRVACGEDFGLALTTGGKIYSFGTDIHGELGQGPESEFTNEPEPFPGKVDVPAAAGAVTRIAAGGDFALALTASGTLYYWGEDGFGQAGGGGNIGFDHTVPIPVTLPGATGPIVGIGAGSADAYAVTSSGQLFAWGNNGGGELGTVEEPMPPDDFNSTPALTLLPAGTSVDTVASGAEGGTVLAVVSDLSLGTALPGARAGSPYAASLAVSGGTPPYSFALEGLPTGLLLDPSSGAISGTPALPGAFGLSATVTDAFGIKAGASSSLGVAPPAAGGGGGGGGGGGLSAAALRKALLSQLGVKGKAGKIGAILKHGYALKFKAPEAGKATIQWFFLPKGAHVSKRKKPKPVLVASGSQSFAAAATKTLTIRLTARGRAMLRHARHETLTAKGTFAPASGGPVGTTKRLSLSR